MNINNNGEKRERGVGRGWSCVGLVDSDVDVAYLVEVSGSTSTSGCILRWFGWVVSWTRVGGELVRCGRREREG